MAIEGIAMRWLILFLCSVLRAETIVIDPGHGGKYIGTANTAAGLVEKNLALDVAVRLARKLTLRGYTVILTRDTDTELDKDTLIADLTKRAQIAADHTADLFVSLHFNGSRNPRSAGFEIYVPFEDKYPIKSYCLASALHYHISHEVSPHWRGGSLGNLNALDGGIKASRFNVIKKATCPAVLVELAYLTNEETANKLKTDQFKDILVDGVSKGIERYIRQQRASTCSRPRCRRWRRGRAL